MLLQAISRPKTCSVECTWQRSILAGMARKAEHQVSHNGATGTPGKSSFINNTQAGLRRQHLHHARQQARSLPSAQVTCKGNSTQHPRVSAQMLCSACRDCCQMAGKLLLAHSLCKHSGQADPTLKTALCKKLT